MDRNNYYDYLCQRRDHLEQVTFTVAAPINPDEPVIILS